MKTSGHDSDKVAVQVKSVHEFPCAIGQSHLRSDPSHNLVRRALQCRNPTHQTLLEIEFSPHRLSCD